MAVAFRVGTAVARGAVVIPGPTPSGYAWRAAPIQRARQAQAAAPFAPPRRQPFSKLKAGLHNGSDSPLKTATIYEFSTAVESLTGNESPRLGAHWFASKPGHGMSDCAIRLLRLKGWLEICLADRRFESEAYVTECRLREQAAYIIGYFA